MRIEDVLYNVDVDEVTREFTDAFNTVMAAVQESLRNLELKKKEIFGTTSIKKRIKKEKPSLVAKNLSMIEEQTEVLKDITDNNVRVQNLKIKKEKLSNLEETSNSENVPERKSDVEMPAPKKPVSKARKNKIKGETVDEPLRSTRTKKNTKSGSDVSVIIEITPVPVIDITDDSYSLPTRTTRSKARQKTTNAKTRETVPERVEEEVTQSRKKSKFVLSAGSDQSTDNFEDGLSIVGETVQTNSAFVTSKNSENNANETYIASKGQTENDNNTIFTTCFQQESVIDKTYDVLPEETPQAKQILVPENLPTPISPKTVHKNKTIFSPYGKTTTQQKVEAFEKLNKKPDTSEASSKIHKYVTPIKQKFEPTKCSTAIGNKTLPKSPETNANISKNLRSLKASQKDFRERERQRQAREQEALKKKEALLQGLAEKNKKKREEKLLKAHKQREMIELENKRKMELQKLKEEKYKKSLAEKEEKLQKQKEEAEKKRLLVKKRAEEMRKKQQEETENQIASPKPRPSKMTPIKTVQEPSNASTKKKLPLYMMTNPPLLPTEDCFDSDEEGYKTAKIYPLWTKTFVLKKQQSVMLIIDENIKNTFFCVQAQTPKLMEIFENIDTKKLKRTSSAIWRKPPPRYTQFRETSNIIFSEDED